MIQNKIYITILLTTLLITNLYSQKVETVRLEIEKEIPDESFSDNKFEVDFWVQAERFSSINLSNTELLLLEDDTGKDLIKAHEKGVIAYNEESERLAKKGHYRFSTTTEGLFKPEDWRPMQDTIGFKATIKSGMARPAKEATKAHVKMRIAYFIKSSSNEEDSITTTVPSLYNSPSFMLQKKKIKLDDGGSMTHDDQKFIIYRIPKNEVGISIQSIRVLDEEGKPLERISGGLGSYEFMVKEGNNKKPVTLVLNYLPVSEKKITIDTWVSLGL